MRPFRFLSLACAALILLAASSLAQAQTKTTAKSSGPRAGGTHVYLLRGLFNVFSTGMDDLAEKLNRRGIRASVYNHTEHPGLAAEIAAQYRAGRGERIVIVGHSLGANDAIRMAALLGQYKINVPLVITYDPTASMLVSGNVSRVVNFYQSNNGWGARIAPGRGFHGSLSNIDLARDPDIGHASIDKSNKLHMQSIGYIGGGRAAAPPASTPSKASSQAPAAAAGKSPPL